MIRAAHFEHWVVRPTLNKLSVFDNRLSSENAVQLMMGTAAQESDLWFNLVQLGNGPGRGGYSIEPDTHTDVWRYLNRPGNWPLREIVLGLARESAVSVDDDGNYSVDDSELLDMHYSTAIARIKYWMIPDSMPDDLDGWARYWDDFYNANPNVGFPHEFVNKYNRLVVGI